MSEAQKRVAIFVSGTGTNCENIIRYFAGSEVVNIALVVSNKSDAPALEKARRLGVPTEVVSKSQLSDSSFMLSLLRERDIHFIVLAGFLLMIPDYLIAAYPAASSICILPCCPSLAARECMVTVCTRP